MKSRLVVVAVIQKNGEYLVGQKPKNVGPYPNTWHIPGGGVDLNNESSEEALKREIREETGIEIQNVRAVGFDEDEVPNKHGEMTRYVFLDYEADYLSGDIKANDDMAVLKWVRKEELKTLNLNKPCEKLFKKLKLI